MVAMRIELQNCSLEIRHIGIYEQTLSIDDLYESLMKVCGAIAQAFSDLVETCAPMIEACRPALDAWIKLNAAIAPAPKFYGLHRI